MHDFHNPFEQGSAHAKAPLKAQAPEQPDKDTLRHKPKLSGLIFPISILLCIAILLIYVAFVPPLTKLSLKMLVKNYTVTIVRENEQDVQKTQLRIKGNLIQCEFRPENSQYYELEDGILYKYVSYSPDFIRPEIEWVKKECEENELLQKTRVGITTLEAWEKLFI